MELQFYGANCVVMTYKGVRLVFDDNLAQLGGKSVSRPGDVVLFTGRPHADASKDAKLMIDMAGEYEVGDVSITGIGAKLHIDEKEKNGTMYRIQAGDTTLLVTGHIAADLTESQLERIGMVDVMVVPVGGHGYTLDPIGALKVIKAVEPKLAVPTYYADKALKFEVPATDLASALHDLGMEPRETVNKLKVKPADLSDITQLVVLEKS
ncbi:MBL fold metallo-hydrolase [Candidatus Saccharibacteria bacterium]|nr:MBL fold metallo-hydrolase [Candidatus Saccharibacteria bacterium]